MNEKVDEEFKDIKDVYVLQCICSELKDRLEKYRHLFKTTKIEEKGKEIERLKNELQDTKEHLGEYLHEQEEENKRLNNIINELLKYIEEKAEENDDNTMISKSYKFALYNILGKLQELKESDKE